MTPPEGYPFAVSYLALYGSEGQTFPTVGEILESREMTAVLEADDAQVPVVVSFGGCAWEAEQIYTTYHDSSERWCFAVVYRRRGTTEARPQRRPRAQPKPKRKRKASGGCGGSRFS